MTGKFLTLFYQELELFNWPTLGSVRSGPIFAHQELTLALVLNNNE